MYFYLILFIISVPIIYIWFIRPWQIRWGATDDEIDSSMQGDEVVKLPTFNATRAVTIHARPKEIWPWILQIGSKRAGWYSLDWIDNGNIPSAERIIPALQHMDVDDFVPMTPDGKNGMWVKACDTDKYMLWWDKKDKSTWLWRLEPIDEFQTRLITRLRVRYAWTSIWVIYYLLQDVGDIIMMRKCMLGIQRRAERLAKESATQTTQTIPA